MLRRRVHFFKSICVTVVWLTDVEHSCMGADCQVNVEFEQASRGSMKNNKTKKKKPQCIVETIRKT